jgi:hypothetical protein
MLFYNCKDDEKNMLYQSLQDLELNHAYVIYPGEDTCSLSQQVTVIPLKEFLSKLVANEI